MSNLRPRDTNFKATPLSNSAHIIYDGYSSRLFGVKNVQPSSGLVEEIFIANTTPIEDKSRYNDRTYLLGINREPLQFSMRLLFDPFTFDERKLQEIKRWFYQDTYKEFRYDSGQEQDLDIWVYAICTGESKVFHNAIDDAYIDFTFKTNAPYRFSQVMEDEFDFSKSNSEVMIEEFDKGFFDVTEAIDDLSSRLKQTVIPKSEVTNRTPDEYRKLIYPYIVSSRESRDLIDKPFEELSKVKNSLATYRNQWNAQKTILNRVINDAQILWNRIESVGNSYLNRTPNLYSKTTANSNTRLHPDGDETYSTWYKTSDFIEITDDKYVWYTSGSVSSIEIATVGYYDFGRNFIEGKQMSASSSHIIDNFPSGAAYFKVSARINTYSDDRWKIERNRITSYTASPYDLFPEIEEQRIMKNVADLENVLNNLDSIKENVTQYVKNYAHNVDNTLEIYPNIVSLYNFGDLPCKPVFEIEITDAADIRIENLDTNESTTITDNVVGEKITIKNETEQIETSRTKITGHYYKYDSHDDNFITLGQFENQLQFYGGMKVKITYQFKIL